MVDDRFDFEVRLSQLRAEIAGLSDLAPLSPEFGKWLEKLFNVVRACFGLDSSEMRQLRAISPELPSEFYDSIEARIGSLGLDNKSTNQLLTGLNRDSHQAIFKKRLHDYDDLIASMIIGFRPPS